MTVPHFARNYTLLVGKTARRTMQSYVHKFGFQRDFDLETCLSIICSVGQYNVRNRLEIMDSRRLDVGRQFVSCNAGIAESKVKACSVCRLLNNVLKTTSSHSILWYDCNNCGSVMAFWRRLRVES